MTGDADRPVAFALLSKDELAYIGPSLRLVFGLPKDGTFDELLAQLDQVVLSDERD